MKRSSRSSKKRRRSDKEREAWALRAIFNAMHAVGVTVTNGDEAEQAMGLAAGMLSYVLQRKVSRDEIRGKMLALIEEDMKEGMREYDEATTKH